MFHYTINFASKSSYSLEGCNVNMFVGLLKHSKKVIPACDEFHYGINCAQKCDCGIGADHCDSVTGCVCKDGWGGKQCFDDLNECDSVTSPCAGIICGQTNELRQAC